MEIKSEKIETINLNSNPISSGQFSIDEKNFTHITRLLSKSLYSNPIRTLMTEYVQNALDAHSESRQTEKIIVTLPSVNYPYYEVEDFGMGMSPDFVLNQLTKYGASTKINTNKQAGGFGIGFKASAIYCDSFVMIVNYNKTEYVYEILNHEGSGNITLLDQYPSTKHNGVKIQIQIASNDINKFFDIINDGIYNRLTSKIHLQIKSSNNEFQEVLFGFNHYIRKISGENYDLYLNHDTTGVYIYSNNIFINKLDSNFFNTCKSLLHTDGATYFDNYEQIYKIFSELGNKFYYNISLFDKICWKIDINIPVGQFEISVNRESFINTTDFYMYITKKIIDIYDNVLACDNKTIDNGEKNTIVQVSKLFDNLIIKQNNYNKIENIITNIIEKNTRSLIDDKKIIEFNNNLKRNSIFYFKLQVLSPCYLSRIFNNQFDLKSFNAIDYNFVIDLNKEYNPRKRKFNIEQNYSIEILSKISQIIIGYSKDINKLVKPTFSNNGLVYLIYIDKNASIKDMEEIRDVYNKLLDNEIPISIASKPIKHHIVNKSESSDFIIATNNYNNQRFNVINYGILTSQKTNEPIDIRKILTYLKNNKTNQIYYYIIPDNVEYNLDKVYEYLSQTLLKDFIDILNKLLSTTEHVSQNDVASIVNNALLSNNNTLIYIPEYIYNKYKSYLSDDINIKNNFIYENFLKSIKLLQQYVFNNYVNTNYYIFNNFINTNNNKFSLPKYLTDIHNLKYTVPFLNKMFQLKDNNLNFLLKKDNSLINDKIDIFCDCYIHNIIYTINRFLNKNIDFINDNIKLIVKSISNYYNKLKSEEIMFIYNMFETILRNHPNSYNIENMVKAIINEIDTLNLK